MKAKKIKKASDLIQKALKKEKPSDIILTIGKSESDGQMHILFFAE